jgi:hypothetical protein
MASSYDRPVQGPLFTPRRRRFRNVTAQSGRRAVGAMPCVASMRRLHPARSTPSNLFTTVPPSPQIAIPVTVDPKVSLHRGLYKPVAAQRVSFGERVTPVAAGRLVPAEWQQCLPERVVPGRPIHSPVSRMGTRTLRSVAISDARS